MQDPGPVKLEKHHGFNTTLSMWDGTRFRGTVDGRTIFFGRSKQDGSLVVQRYTSQGSLQFSLKVNYKSNLCETGFLRRQVRVESLKGYYKAKVFKFYHNVLACLTNGVASVTQQSIRVAIFLRLNSYNIGQAAQACNKEIFMDGIRTWCPPQE